MIAAATVETWDARHFTPAQARAIGELIHQTWPKPHLTAELRAIQQLEIGPQFLGPARRAPRAIVVVDGGRVLAHAAVVPRVARSANGELAIAGLSRVCTAQNCRGQGLGEAVVKAALAIVDAGDFHYALFQTNYRVMGFYNKLGAVPVANPIVNSLAEDPTASVFWDEVVMRYPARGNWPAGTIDLRGSGY